MTNTSTSRLYGMTTNRSYVNMAEEISIGLLWYQILRDLPLDIVLGRFENMA